MDKFITITVKEIENGFFNGINGPSSELMSKTQYFSNLAGVEGFLYDSASSLRADVSGVFVQSGN